jgi:hypothetical protein
VQGSWLLWFRDDVYTGTLCGYHEVDTDSTCQLRQPRDGMFHLFAGSKDQVGKLIYHQDDVWQEAMPVERVELACYNLMLYSLIFLTWASFNRS